jgi:hypothetical protein
MIVRNEGYLLQEISGSWTKYVSQISINAITYHHSRLLIETQGMDALEPRIAEFYTDELATKPQHTLH